jgi:hypothetical protein
LGTDKILLIADNSNGKKLSLNQSPATFVLSLFKKYCFQNKMQIPSFVEKFNKTKGFSLLYITKELI